MPRSLDGADTRSGARRSRRCAGPDRSRARCLNTVGVVSSTPQPPLTTSGVRIRALHRCDLSFVVRLHRSEFPANVMSRFGTAALRAYYVSFLTSPHAMAYAVERDGWVVGYLVGIVRPGEHRRRLLRRHLPRLGLTLTMGMATNPRLTVALLAARRSRRRASRDGAEAGPDDTTGSESVVAVLSHVAVAPEHRGQGLGGPLVERFEREAFDSGATRLCLATAEGSAAAGFYERRGWRLTTRRTTVDDRPISLYALDREGAARCVDPAP